MATTRKLLVPIELPSGRVSQGHLIPQLGVQDQTGFLRLPGSDTVQYGLMAYLGSDVSAKDMLARWREDFPPAGRGGHLSLLERYIELLQPFKVGSILTIEYGPGEAFQLRKEADHPPREPSRLPNP